MMIQGLQKMLSDYEHITLSAAYTNAAELLQGLAEAVPDVLLLDIQLPDRTGDELVQEILDQYPLLKILVLTNFDSSMYITKMVWQGVHGYLLKTTEEATLIHAIETVFSGQQYIEPDIQEKIDQYPLRSKRIFTTKSVLTTREKEILQLIVNGSTDQEISQTLFLNFATIKHYRMSLLLKLDAKNCKNATHYCAFTIFSVFIKFPSRS